MGLTYADHRGVPELRNAVAEYLTRVRGVVAEPDHVIVCCAASHALTVLWRALRHQGGRRVAVEDPGWRPQRRTAEQAGLEAIPVRVDAGGLVVSELAAADVDAVVLTPAHHYPTGVVMTAERRGALIAWARQRRALIVEDDHDAEYRFGRDPAASLQGLAPISSRSSGQQANTRPRLAACVDGPSGGPDRRRRGRARSYRCVTADARSDGYGLVHPRRRARAPISVRCAGATAPSETSSSTR
jgi:DNA-binding transcriptional MocR family regulator